VLGQARRLDLPVETILFRVAQEAITNIVRHAQTSRAQVELEFSEGEVRLTVADQGQGFDVDSVFRAPRGWGLEGMRERVEAAGGRFTLASLRGCGTTVAAVIPVAEAAVPVLAGEPPADSAQEERI
jgi:two-component system NarL family sensor kinase